MTIAFEVKRNPAPNEWTVLTWRMHEGQRDILAFATFHGNAAEQLANEYFDLQNRLLEQDAEALGVWLLHAMKRRQGQF